MKIILVSQEYPPETAHGGIAAQTHLKARGLSRLGHDVTVLSHSLDDRASETRDGDVRIIRISGYDASLPTYKEEVRWLQYSARIAARLQELITQDEPDVIDFVEYGGEGFYYLLNRESETGPRCFVHIQGPVAMLNGMLGWPESDSQLYRVGSFMEATCLRLADGVYSSSAYSADWCRRSYHLESKTIPVLHAGVDTDVFYPRPVPKAPRPTIAFVGRIAESKGVGVLVQATLKVADKIPGLRLQLIGRCDDGFLKRLQSDVSQSAHPDLLETPGHVSHAELPEYLSRAHVFAAPSFAEGGPGFVYLEAMACGLPVIGCNGSGITEVIRHEHTGYLIPPRTVDTLQAVLEDILTDPDKQRHMAQAALEYIRLEADSDVCVRRMADYYQTEILQRQRELAA